MVDNHKPELVCFDLGRVLVRLCDGWGEACAIAGVKVRITPLAATRLMSIQDIIERTERGELGLDAFSNAVSGALGVSVEDVNAVSGAYLRSAFPGAVELIEELNALGLKTAVLSNTMESHWNIIQDPKSQAYFPLEKLTWQFASHLVRMRKPEARIYRHVVTTTGVAPDKIVFFDDLEANVDAARKCGWRGFVITDRADPIAQARKYLASCGALR